MIINDITGGYTIIKADKWWYKLMYMSRNTRVDGGSILLWKTFSGRSSWGSVWHENCGMWCASGNNIKKICKNTFESLKVWLHNSYFFDKQTSRNWSRVADRILLGGPSGLLNEKWCCLFNFNPCLCVPIPPHPVLGIGRIITLYWSEGVCWPFPTKKAAATP